MTAAANQWVAKAEELARTSLALHAEDVDRQGRWPTESIAALGASGLLGLTVPQKYGGAEEGARTFSAVTRILAEQCASTAMIYLMHVCATQMISAATTFPKREEVLRASVGGRHLSTLAFSEKGSRSHFWAPISKAVVEGDTHRLSAEKSFVTSAGRADSYVVCTRSASANDPLVSTLYFVPADAPGIHVGPAWNGLGLRGNASAAVQFEGVTVPASNRLSDEGGGFNAMLNTVLPWFQIGTAAVAVGIARAATEATRQHLLAAKFEHLDQRLSSLPTLRARLAQMRIAVDVQSAFVEHVAGLMERPDAETMLAVLESKAAAAETALHVSDLAMRVCGGAAFGRRLTVERHFRDARAGSIMAPTTDVLYDFVAKILLEMPLFGDSS
ncbi:MAG TPA: acyl-CoA dehydrogenase family protein [Gemmataceae bacterium]|jgi:alkylation response protein AidB-like acyl-CoA dehydrogenase